MNNIDYISSNANNKIKFIKSLNRKKYRDSEGYFIVEGTKIIEECLDNDYNLKYLVINKSFFENIDNMDLINKIYSKNIEIIFVLDNIFKEITDTETPQGILGISKKIDGKMGEFIYDNNGFYLILDGIQDPGNMGTIIRTADAFGVSGILIGEGSVDIYNSKVVRATMGSIYRMPIYNVMELKSLKKQIVDNNIKVYSTSLKGEKNLENIEYRGSMFILGNESKGVSKPYEELSTDLVKIPMIGKVESLNVAVASSIIMYESMVNRIG